MKWASVAAGLLLASVALCRLGLSAVTADYDGVLSWFNPIADGSCCGAVVLAVLAAVVLTHPRGPGRRR